MINKFSAHGAKCGIYGIYIDNKVAYIGQSKNLQQRAYNHERYIRRGYGPSLLWYPLAKTFYEHGHNFTFKVIEEIEENLLLEKELEYIDMYSPIFNTNIRTGKKPIPLNYSSAIALLNIKERPLKDKTQIINEERAAAIGWFGELPPIQERF